MALFSRFPNNDLAPLFRLLDDYNVQGTGGFSNSSVRAFQPKFDVREHKDSYELQGELPGIDQKDVHIQFADPHTLVIKGRVEREYSSDGSHEPQGRITGDVTDSSKSHKATVEDDNEESATNGAKSKEVTKSSEQSHQKHHKNHTKYWVSERSVGEFHRAFTFPSRVDQDAVKANLKNGILSVVVPKATTHEGKRIVVE
ncbi:hypothetical protein JMJ35_008900 [Cladonia borealis]|uniref:SHSP domain-containing protein n=1 Tax=Cladonia borealis TaxID=184061 RepID=A0AA39QVD9_9LECA|nr:hypothetical protein JMJ35_008900 [Cladonia borealis]